MTRVLVEDRGYETPCHVWQGSTNNKGYGTRKVAGRIMLAHVVAYEETHGPVPAGLVLDHLCRVRCCVNPDHLEATTQAENVRRGVRTRLTEADVLAIRARAGEPRVIVAADYGVHPSWISRIIHGRNANRLGAVPAWSLS